MPIVPPHSTPCRSLLVVAASKLISSLRRSLNPSSAAAVEETCKAVSRAKHLDVKFNFIVLVIMRGMSDDRRCWSTTVADIILVVCRDKVLS